MRKCNAIKFAILSLCLILVPFATVSAESCELTIESTDQMKFNTTEMKVPAGCDKVSVVLKNTGTLARNVMGHNWVLAEDSEVAAILTEGMKAGLEKEYLPEDKSKILAKTKLIGGGETDTISVDITKLDKSKSYTFFCSFPGHSTFMKGKFVLG